MKQYIALRNLLLALALSFGASNAKAENSINSTAVLNSYGSTVPAGLIGTNAASPNIQLMDTRNGGVANVSNAQLEFLCDFSPDWREETTGKSGKTKLIVVASWDADSRLASAKNPTDETPIFKNLKPNEQPDFSRVIGTITIISRQGQGASIDLSTIRYDVAAYAASRLRGTTISSRMDFIASSYGAAVGGEGFGVSNALGGLLNGVTAGGALGLTTNSGTANLNPFLSLTYLILK